MKGLFTLFLLSFCSIFYSKAQSNLKIEKEFLIGIWQSNSNEESAAWLDSYTFFQNNNFIFRPSQYDGLKRIVAIIGKFSIKGDSIYFKADSVTESFGGNLQRSNLETLNDSWTLEDATYKTLKIKSSEESAILEKCLNAKSGKSCIMIDKRIFYKGGVFSLI